MAGAEPEPAITGFPSTLKGRVQDDQVIRPELPVDQPRVTNDRIDLDLRQALGIADRIGGSLGPARRPPPTRDDPRCDRENGKQSDAGVEVCSVSPGCGSRAARTAAAALGSRRGRPPARTAGHTSNVWPSTSTSNRRGGRIVFPSTISPPSTVETESGRGPLGRHDSRRW